MIEALKAWGKAAATALGLVDFAAKWAKQAKDENTGAKLNELDHARANLEGVSDANLTRDRLHADPGYRDSVRDRFTER